MTGRKHRKDSIEKMRKSKIGKEVSQETRDKIRITLKNKHKLGTIETAFKKGHKAFPLSEDGKQKISEAHTGDKNKHWMGGTMKWARQQVRIRDDYTCQICGLRDLEIIEVDHIKPIRKHKRYGFVDDIKNMQCICPNCHRRKTNLFLRELYKGKLLPTKKYV